MDGDAYLKTGAPGAALHEIMIMFMGVETFSFEWAERRDEIIALDDAMTLSRRDTYRIIAESPALVVCAGGNYAPEVLGLERFRDFVLPHWEEAAGILPNEELHVWNITRGTRIVTYALAGPHDSGVICINGAAAHGNEPGDLVILATFGEMSEEEARVFEPKVILVNRANEIVDVRAEVPGPQMPPRIPDVN